MEIEVTYEVTAEGGRQSLPYVYAAGTDKEDAIRVYNTIIEWSKSGNGEYLAGSNVTLVQNITVKLPIDKYVHERV